MRARPYGYRGVVTARLRRIRPGPRPARPLDVLLQIGERHRLCGLDVDGIAAIVVGGPLCRERRTLALPYPAESGVVLVRPVVAADVRVSRACRGGVDRRAGVRGRR